MAEIRIILKGEIPSKKNCRITLPNGKTIPSRRYMEWHRNQKKSVLNQIKNYKSLLPITTPIVMTVIFTHGDLRRRDGDNGLSSVLDLFVDCKIIDDDNWRIVKTVHLYNDYQKGNAQCTVVISFVEKCLLESL